MIICGIKLTHDGGIALIEGDELKFSIEIEKIANNPRYSSLSNLSCIPTILHDNGYNIESVDHFVVDGWHGSSMFDTGQSYLEVKSDNEDIKLEVASYNEGSIENNILKRREFKGLLKIKDKIYDYVSYTHIAGHLLGAYCSSVFAQKNQDSYILCWDGGQYPRLYFYDAKSKVIRNLGHLFFFLGTVYSIFGQYFGPYKKSDPELEEERELKNLEGFFGGYSSAGKIMAYIALGQIRPELLTLFKEVYTEDFQVSDEFEHIFARKVKSRLKSSQYKDEDILATFHLFLDQLLIHNLEKKVDSSSFSSRNICITGGCALNIKWNSSIRNMGLFDNVWVPPFANDSGSAIGMACCERFHQTGTVNLSWNVYSGPLVIENNPSKGWIKKECSLKELANLMFVENEPIVFMHDRAEIGPRALGNRSILALASNAEMKNIINAVKGREYYRPVAPICLAEYAKDIFHPGFSDPYMLFDHQVKAEWKDRIPSICHLDGTARLQTVTKKLNPVLYELLSCYYNLSGIPVLCNTSANFNGSGFFPDIHSVTKWGGVNFVWCNGFLYEKKDQLN